MKSQELKKISLAVLAAFALAACGSDGDGNNHTSSAATDTTTAAQSDAAKLAAQAAADKKAAEEAAAKAAADKLAAEDLMNKIAADKKAEEEKKKAEEAAAAAEAANNDHTLLTSEVKAKRKESFVGFKNVVKNDSNLQTNNSSTQESKADVPEGLNVQNPEWDLNTIVVGEDLKAKKAIYLDNFTFTGTPTTTPADGKAGMAVHLKQDTKTSAGPVAAPTAPTADALVYQPNRVNYTNNYGKNINGSTVANADAEIFDAIAGTAVNVHTGATATNGNDTRNGLDEVAEVYGNKTVESTPVAAGKNLPLQNSTLNYVQYGRVTSNLHGREVKNMKDGISNGSQTGTVIGSYAALKDPNSESHYFYRGTDNMTAAQLADVKTKYAKFDYAGHAVSYGLDNNYNSGLGKGNTFPIPTAVHTGYNLTPYAALVSGNHVKATVDLTNNAVEGSIYNQWFDGYKVGAGSYGTPPLNYAGTVVSVPLVEFKGTLAENGNIAGTSTYKAVENSNGVFGATMFGSSGSEMGGMVASDNKDPSKGAVWGAGFGLERVGVTPVSAYAPAPAQPAPLPSLSTGNNSSNP